jgi:hypothetical protein
MAELALATGGADFGFFLDLLAIARPHLHIRFSWSALIYWTLLPGIEPTYATLVHAHA